MVGGGGLQDFSGSPRPLGLGFLDFGLRYRSEIVVSVLLEILDYMDSRIRWPMFGLRWIMDFLSWDFGLRIGFGSRRCTLWIYTGTNSLVSAQPDGPIAGQGNYITWIAQHEVPIANHAASIF